MKDSRLQPGMAALGVLAALAPLALLRALPPNRTQMNGTGPRSPSAEEMQRRVRAQRDIDIWNAQVVARKLAKKAARRP